MSFSGKVKEELARNISSARHCQIAELTAFIGMCGTVVINSFDRCSIKIRTENILVARKVFTLIEKTFNIRSDISVRRNIKKQTETYSVIVKKHEDAIRILQATKMIGEQQENAEELHAVNPMIVQQVCCRRAFLRGTFQASGSMSDPNKAYHFEIVCSTEEMLKLCQLELPKHTFYVDNIYVYYPLPHVRTLYYMNVDLYRYFIGREDQSVNEKVMISRIDQQLFVTKKMISMYELRLIGSKKLRKYMVNYLAIMMTVSSILCIRSKKKENFEKKKELWAYLKKKDYRTYMKIRYGILGQTMNLPGRSGRRVSSLAYTVARRLIGFN